MKDKILENLETQVAGKFDVIVFGGGSLYCGVALSAADAVQVYC